MIALLLSQSKVTHITCDHMTHSFHLHDLGARAYFLKALLHDFDDAESRRLLQHTVDAMGPDSSLLIDDWVLPHVNAPVAGGTYDIMMLLILSGM